MKLKFLFSEIPEIKALALSEGFIQVPSPPAAQYEILRFSKQTSEAEELALFYKSKNWGVAGTPSANQLLAKLRTKK